MKKPTLSIAVDFDGTLCEDAYPNIGASDIELVGSLICAQIYGIKLILNTCREGSLLQDALDWCSNRCLHFDAVNENLTERIEYFGGDCRKVSADLVLDDRAAGWDRLVAIESIRKLRVQMMEE